MLKFLIGDAVDYEAIIKEKFPNCNVEVIQPDFLEMDMLIEYITDDIKAAIGDEKDDYKATVLNVLQQRIASLRSNSVIPFSFIIFRILLACLYMASSGITSYTVSA